MHPVSNLARNDSAVSKVQISKVIGNARAEARQEFRIILVQCSKPGWQAFVSFLGCCVDWNTYHLAVTFLLFVSQKAGMPIDRVRGSGSRDVSRIVASAVAC